MTGGVVVLIPGSLTRRRLLSLVQPKASKASETLSPSPVWVPDRDRPLPILSHHHAATVGETQVETLPPRKPIQSTATLVPAPNLPSVHLSAHTKKQKQKVFLLFPGGRLANLRHSQCTHAHLRQFCKVPVYLLSGRCPQNIMHHTYKSFTLFVCVSFFLFLSFLCVVSPSQSKKK